MKNLVVISILFSIFSIFSSCSNHNERYIQQVDSLTVMLDSAEVTLSKVGKDFVLGRNDYCNSKFSKIGSITDTLTKEEALIVDHFNGVCRAYRKWGEKFPVLEKNIDLIKEQLGKLKNDLSKNLIPEEDVVTYVEHETQAVNSLVSTCIQMNAGLKSIEGMFKENDQKILLLIQKFEQSSKR